MPVVRNIYGTAGSDANTYSISDVAVNSTVFEQTLKTIAASINTERARRNLVGSTPKVPSSDSYPFTWTGPGTNVTAAELNQLITAIKTATIPYTAGYNGASATANVKASDVNLTIDKLQAAGAVCVCNCNYCTCNCNYCTCNCNYACTCNCNYSDQRLKQDIEFIETKNGLNIYSFKYVWDAATTHIGVMAQEIINTKYSNAVTKDKDGYFMVDYNKLPV